MKSKDTQSLTFCITCHTELPPETEIHYIHQSPLHPEKYDLDFHNELLWMLDQMRALFDVLGFGEAISLEGDTKEQLAKLGYEVACEAKRRWASASHAIRHQSDRLREVEAKLL